MNMFKHPHQEQREEQVSLPNTVNDEIIPSIDDVLICQFSSWYPIFSNLSKYSNNTNTHPTTTHHHHHHRNNVTIKSYIIKPLPDEFIAYLSSSSSSGLVLPVNAKTSLPLLEYNTTTIKKYNKMKQNKTKKQKQKQNGDEYQDDEDNDTNDDSDSDSDWSDDVLIYNTDQEQQQQQEDKQYSFPELDKQIHDIIYNQCSKQRQSVIPKLNWSSPKDAIWMNGGHNTMECSTSGDIYLLCKSSNDIIYDIDYAIQDTTIIVDPVHDRYDNNNNNDQEQDDKQIVVCREEFTYELVLRQYCPNLYRCQEFRCFISYNTIIGICQRYISQEYYTYLYDKIDHYTELIYNFYTDIVQCNINKICTKKQAINSSNNNNDSNYYYYTIQQYTMDIYIDQQDRIYIIDFNVWGTRTDALLYTWKELTNMATIARAGAKTATNNDTIQQQQNDDQQSFINDILFPHNNDIDFRIVQPSNNNNTTTNVPQPQPNLPDIYPHPLLSSAKAPLDALLFNTMANTTTTPTAFGTDDNDPIPSTSSMMISTTTFQDFMKLCVKPSTILSDSDDD